MRLFIVIIINFISLNISNCQSYHTFKDTGNNYANAILAVKGGYILWVTNECDTHCNSAYKVDLNDSVYYKMEFNDFIGRLYKSNLPNIEYVISGFGKVNNKYELILIEVDFNGNIRKTLRFNDSIANLVNSQVVDDGQGYIFSSTKRPPTPNLDTIFIFKTDYNGKILWEKSLNFEDSAFFLVNGLFQMTHFANNEFAVVGKYTYNDNQTPVFAKEKSILVRFNGEGVFSYGGYMVELRRYLWDFNTDPNKYTGAYHYICESSKGFIISTLHDTIITIPNKGWASEHALLIEFDKNNQAINHTTIPHYIDAQIPLAILKCRNNDILYLDYGGDDVFYPDYDDAFRITRINTEGVIEWQRTYVSLIKQSSTGIYYGQFNFQGMTEIEDGRIAICGSYTTFIESLKDFDDDAFVMILDSMGCFKLDCQIYTNVFSLLQVSSNESNSFNNKIFPNPTGGLLNIELEYQVNEANIKIYNLYGKNVLTKRQPGNNKIQQINISELNNGIYLLQVESKGRIIYKKSFIKID